MTERHGAYVDVDRSAKGVESENATAEPAKARAAPRESKRMVCLVDTDSTGRGLIRQYEAPSKASGMLVRRARCWIEHLRRMTLM